MAEGLMRSLGGGAVEVVSAGTEPSGVHPLALKTMADLQIDIRDQRAKPMAEFLDQRFDYVVTVCDRASESCPIFPGDPERIHWSIPDPAAVEGDEKTRARAFQEAAAELTTRIRFLLVAIHRESR